MTKAELLTMKISGKSVQFKDLIGLKRAAPGQSDVLADFCRFVHPGADMTNDGAQVTVFTKKGHYVYSLYTEAILKTNVNNGTRTLYKLPNSLGLTNPSNPKFRKRR